MTQRHLLPISLALGVLAAAGCSADRPASPWEFDEETGVETADAAPTDTHRLMDDAGGPVCSLEPPKGRATSFAKVNERERTWATPATTVRAGCVRYDYRLVLSRRDEPDASDHPEWLLEGDVTVTNNCADLRLHLRPTSDGPASCARSKNGIVGRPKSRRTDDEPFRPLSVAALVSSDGRTYASLCPKVVSRKGICDLDYIVKGRVEPGESFEAPTRQMHLADAIPRSLQPPPPSSYRPELSEQAYWDHPIDYCGPLEYRLWMPRLVPDRDVRWEEAFTPLAICNEYGFRNHNPLPLDETDVDRSAIAVTIGPLAFPDPARQYIRETADRAAENVDR